MKKILSIILLLIIFLLSINVVVAKEFSIVSSIDGEPLFGFVRLVGVGDYYLFKGDKLNFNFSSNDSFVLFMKNKHLETFDYMAELSDKSSSVIVVNPIGLLKLSVKDVLDNFIIGAKVIINCPIKEYSLKTNEVGSLRVFLPPENCSIDVLYKNKVNSSTVLIKQGLISEKMIVLENIKKNNYLLYGLLFLLFIVIISFYLFFKKKKMVIINEKRIIEDDEKKISTLKEELEEELKKEEFLVETMRSVLKEKELLIIDSLIARSGRASLSQVRSATHIPRTSLVRTIQGLEQRNLLIKKNYNGKVWVELVKKT